MTTSGTNCNFFLLSKALGPEATRHLEAAISDIGNTEHDIVISLGFEIFTRRLPSLPYVPLRDRPFPLGNFPLKKQETLFALSSTSKIVAVENGDVPSSTATPSYTPSEIISIDDNADAASMGVNAVPERSDSAAEQLLADIVAASHRSKRQRTDSHTPRDMLPNLAPPASTPSPVVYQSPYPAQTEMVSRCVQVDGVQLQRAVQIAQAKLSRNQPMSANAFIAGIWKTIYGTVQVEPDAALNPTIRLKPSVSPTMGPEEFQEVSILCDQVSIHSRTSLRPLQVIVQAHWADCFEKRRMALKVERPHLHDGEVSRVVLGEAAPILKLTEKELKDKMIVWCAYRTLWLEAGWIPLIYAAPGLHRFCRFKFRTFNPEFFGTLKRLRPSFEVAADTLHPRWRELLSFIGIEESRKWTGNQHDWVVNEVEAVPLKGTYAKWDNNFEFEHLTESRIDTEQWGEKDPRLTGKTLGDIYFCAFCNCLQSELFANNQCKCMPELYGGVTGPAPVQVFKTTNGKNNGLIARAPFEHGVGIGEVMGLVTKGISGKDVMQGGKEPFEYQIFQGKMGNYTRFVNHSCAPNSMFQKFSWLGIERIVLVSLGMETGTEITVDYSPIYWHDLDKICLCGAECCRYKEKRVFTNGKTRRIE